MNEPITLPDPIDIAAAAYRNVQVGTPGTPEWQRLMEKSQRCPMMMPD